MSFYLDTSALVSVLTPEPDALRVESWPRSHEGDGLFISGWVAAEFTSALSVKLRRGAIREVDRTNAKAAFDRLRRATLVSLPVSQDDFETAALFGDQSAAPIKAGDALHLAIASKHDLTLCTLDRQQAEAGPKLGVATLRL